MASDSRQAIAFEYADECHLCGMVITRFPGSKGQLYEQEVKTVRKFCSTRDMFSYYLQPENSHRATNIYVHNMAEVPWEKPDDSHLIDARKAWYVINHTLMGAMGPTLAAFETETSAQDFVKVNRGSIIVFSDITLDMLAKLNLSGEAAMSPHPI
jgi:copper chaperone NosL